MKNNLKIYLLTFIMALGVVSCDNGFEEINTNPNNALSIAPEFQFSRVLLNTSGDRYVNWRANLIYSSTIVQHFATLCGYWSGDKYTYNAGYNSSMFDRAFTQTVRDLQDLINTLEQGEVGDQTMLGMARIWRAVFFHRLTDLYGDVPYFEAGKGFIDGIDFPAYDPQEVIYKDMLKELEEGVAQIGSGGFGAADFIYSGDTDQWKKFGNSLMLRLAMRLSEADPATAQEYVSKAIAGGVMTSIDDNAFVPHSTGPEGINMNGVGEVLDLDNGSANETCPRLSKTLVDWMQSNGDPRLSIIATPAVNDGGIRGLPNGLDGTTVLDNGEFTEIDDFSTINQDLVRIQSPMMFMTYAEVEFLLAEAAVRGWHSGSAAEHYENGLRAAMQIYADYDPAFAIPEADVDAYVAANPLSETEPLRDIGWQYWAATLLNEYEAFANLRRSGYPDFTPVDYPGNVTGGQIPSRLVYPQSEISREPFEEARTRQGLGSDFPSMMGVPVWWDK